MIEVPKVTREGIFATKVLPNVATIGRLAMIPPVVESIRDGDTGTTAAWMVAIIAADVGDGVLTRKINPDADGPLRRVIDGSVDKATAVSCFAALAIEHPETLYWYAPLAARGVLHTAQNAYNLVKKKTVLVGSGWHRFALVSQVGLGMSLLAESSTAAIATAASVSYAVNTAQTMSYKGFSYDLPAQESMTNKKISGFSGIRKVLTLDRQ